jgi:hypothetical protein
VLAHRLLATAGLGMTLGQGGNARRAGKNAKAIARAGRTRESASRQDLGWQKLAELDPGDTIGPRQSGVVEMRDARAVWHRPVKESRVG